MDTRYLFTFREVAKCQSFTRAAEILGYAQSSVTTQIQNIETELGVVLFERWGRKIRLTDAGRTFLQYTEQILALLNEAKEVLSEESQLNGTLTIGTVESLAAFYLPPFLQKFRIEQPQLKMLLQPGICSDLRQRVREGAYDFAVLLDELRDEPDLVTINLGQEQLGVIAAIDHRLAGKTQIEVTDFAGEDWIFTESGCSYRTMMEHILQKTGILIQSSFEFGSLEAIKQCVAYGLGLALLPLIAVEQEVQQGKLVVLPFAHTDIVVYRQIVYHKKKRLPIAVQRFFQWLIEHNGNVKEAARVI
ncbi:LysR family transcriptional regulator [Brevibacillus fulvus]|uniref:DNA-binding transcriptional LysR family regulator n=1 Tax=Brevibacillus fulvus TaxID=1125967 RepID=A0A938XZK1_9BACL|nr:LysR family transcriptional regulator [Brevibacillus fulvus]MBM7589311.1 DNA-binding transcriptional LysR family regulator [Brevibacillus fulvus]